MSDSDLHQRLEKLGKQLLTDAEHWELSTRQKRRDAIERLSQKVERHVERALDNAGRRERKEQERRERRAEKRERERQGASTVGGAVFLVIAAACLGFAAVRPQLWWMLFVALGMGLSGARQFALVGERKRLGQPVPPIPEPSAHDREPQAAAPHEVDAICDRLLADLKASPEAVRSFVQQPEKTVESLRTTCKALDERRRQLLAEDAVGRLAALQAQQAALAGRRDAARDPLARTQLDDALRSLDGQATAFRQLAASTERTDGEYTSLLVLLQELRTRVAVAKSSGTGVQLDGLRKSVQRLNVELEAISEAMESVQREGMATFAAVDDLESPHARRERS